MGVELSQQDELESARLPGRPFLLLVAGVLGFLALSLGCLWLVFSKEVPNRTISAAWVPPRPRLLANPGQQLRTVWTQQRARLRGYRWIDRDKKIFAIPVDRAMAIIAARGPDAYAPIPGSSSAPSGGQSASQRP